MTEAAISFPAPGRASGRRVAPMLMCCAVAHACFALVCAVSGVSLLAHGPGSGAAGLNWPVVAVATLAGAVAAAAWRQSPGARVVRRLSVAACGLYLVMAFGFLMDVLALLVGQGVDSVPAALHHAFSFAGAVLLAATALSAGATVDARRSRRPAPAAASRRVHRAAYAGTAAFLPYAGMKATWALGGTFAGVSGEQARATLEKNGASDLWLTLEEWGLDPTVLLAGLGVFLLFGLIRPWGQVFPRWTLFLRGRPVPRWLPLTPALIGTATLVPYGVLGSGYLVLATLGILDTRRGDFPTEHDALLAGWIGVFAFAVYGIALAVAARSYWQRTKPGA